MRKCRGELAEAGDGADMQPGGRGDDGEHDHGDERRRDGFCDPGKQIDDGETQGDEPVCRRRYVHELGELGQENQNGQRVDEAGDHRAGDEAHEPVQTEQARQNLEQSHQDGGGEEILHAVAVDQAAHQDGGGGCGGGDHGDAAAGDGDDAGDDDGGVEPDFWVDPGDHREADGFGDEGQCDDEAGETIDADVAQPLVGQAG